MRSNGSLRAQAKARPECHAPRKWQELKSLVLYFAGKVGHEVRGFGQFSCPKLNRDLPRRNSADQDRILCSRNGFTSRRSESRMSRITKARRGIEEHAQLRYSHSASSLSDMGSKNSGPRTNFPFHEPGWRFLLPDRGGRGGLQALILGR